MAAEVSVIGAVLSPPYSDTPLTGARQFRNRFQPDRPGAASNPREGYGAVEGQIGAMKEGTMQVTQAELDVPHEQWWNCYNDGWGDLICPDAFAHPAKFSKGLIYRIYSEGLRRGWFEPGSTIVDPFGGVGLGGLAAAAHGLQWCGVELETKFIDMAAGHDCPGKLTADNHLCPTCSNDCATFKRHLRDADNAAARANRVLGWETQAPKLKERAAALALSRYRVARTMVRNFRFSGPHHYTGNFELHRKEWEALGKPLPRIVQGDSRQLCSVVQAAMGSVTSPPFVDSLLSKDKDFASKMPNPGRNFSDDGYGTTPGQIGAMKMGSVTSPPFADSTPGSGDDIARNKRLASEYTEKMPYEKRGFLDPDYAKNAEARNIGTFRDATETYWTAVHAVYSQLHALLTPGATAAIVIKGFIRNKRYVDLPGMTLALLQHVGFTPLLWVDAMLVAPESQATLDGGEVRKKKASFFRRLHESKYPELAIDSEVVLVVRRT